MNDLIKILIADDQKDTRESIEKILELTDRFEVIGKTKDGKETLKKVEKLKPDVVLMDINMPNMNGLDATEKITTKYPSTVVIIMSVQNETEYLKKAMLNGAKEYIIKPFDTQQIIHTIQNVYDKQKDLTQNFEKTKKSFNGKITSFFSAKGGVGNTLLACMDSLLKKDKKIILIDLDIYFGDVEIVMGQKSYKTIDKLVENEDLVNALKEYIIKDKDRPDLLLAPKDPADAENIEASHLNRLLDILKNEYDEIILDLGTNYSDLTLAALEKSDQINFVMTPDLMSLKNTKVGLDIFRSLDFKMEDINIWVNKYNMEKNLSTKRIKKVLNKDIFLNIPVDRNNILQAIQLGKSITTSFGFRKNKLVKAFNKIR
ncbi:MAG: response regulator [Bacillota bacterium]